MSAYDYRKNVEESPHYNPSWARPVKGYRAKDGIISAPQTLQIWSTMLMCSTSEGKYYKIGFG